MDPAASVERHYTRSGIAASILAALRAAQGADAPVTPDALAPMDQLHGRGLLATRELVAQLEPQPGERILDIGGGLGGPARWIAAQCRCHVTSLDLTPAFCAAAEALTAAAGLADRVRIVLGSALDLPFPDGSFDRAYTQNVAMNIADKVRFYGEALRVLRPGGALAFANYGAGAAGAPHYPLPWAADPSTSFLATLAATRTEIAAAGFEIVALRDKTAEVLGDFSEARRRLEQHGLPALGAHVAMGARIREAQINAARSAEEGRLTVIDGLARKPG